MIRQATGPTRVLLIARAPDAGAARPELESLLGAARGAQLERVLIRRAASWAASVASGPVHVAYEPAGAEPSLAALVGEPAALFAQRGADLSARLAAAAGRVFRDGEGPVLIAWPDLPRWRPELARAALDDLAEGCDVSLGPVFDGGFYLLALDHPVPPLFSLAEDAWRSPDAMGLALAAVQQAGLEVGVLRAERGLRRPADVRAALSDPLTDEELASILRGG